MPEFLPLSELHVLQMFIISGTSESDFVEIAMLAFEIILSVGIIHLELYTMMISLMSVLSQEGEFISRKDNFMY